MDDTSLELTNINSSTSATGTARTYKITSNTMFDNNNTSRKLSITGMLCDQLVRPQSIGPFNFTNKSDVLNPTTGQDATGQGLTSGTELGKQFSLVGQMAIYTNCLKWNIQSTVKSLFSYFEIQQLIVNSKVENVYPLRIIRYIKLYPEIGVFQEEATTTNTSIHVNNENEHWISAHYQITTKVDVPYNICVIEVSARIINSFKDTSSNMLILFLWSTSLVDLDINAESNQYPVTVNDKAYGNNSGQTMSLNFRLNGTAANWYTNDTASQKYPDYQPHGFGCSVTWTTEANFKHNLSLFELKSFKNVFKINYMALYQKKDTLGKNIAQASAFPVGYDPQRTMYHFFLGSTIYIKTTSDKITDESQLNNIYIPFLCPSAVNKVDILAGNYPENGVFFTTPVATVAWAQMSAYNNVSKINKYVNPLYLSDTSYTDTEYVKFGFNNNVKATNIFDLKLLKTCAQEDVDACRVYIPITLPLYLSRRDTTASTGANCEHFTVHMEDAAGSTQGALAGRKDIYDFSLTTNPGYLKVYFKSYDLTTDDQDKTLYIKSKYKRELSAISIFLNDNVGALSTTVTGTFSITNNPYSNFKVSTTTSNFYIMGKPFNRFLCYAINNTASNFPYIKGNVPGTPSSSTNNINYKDFFSIAQGGSITVIGIPRIDIATFNSPTTINPLNYIAVFTHKNAAVDLNGNTTAYTRHVLSNVLINTSNSFSGFLLWHPAEVNTDWGSIISLDISDNSISDDKGGNIKITGTFPTDVPQGSKIKLTFSTSVIVSNVTVCGLMENGETGLVTDCVVSSPAVTCQMTALAKTFKACCYNITNNNTTINATEGELSLPHSDTIISTTVLPASETYTNVWYKYPGSGGGNLASKDFSTRIVTNISTSSTSFYAKLDNISYILSNTNNGYGIAQLEISLPRNAVRGMTLTVTTDLSKMKIQNVKSRIVATFGNLGLFNAQAEHGDIFVDSVYSSFDGNGLTLKLKNMLYKCGLSLGTNVNIYLWPVLTYNYTNLDVSIAMKSIGNNDLASTVTHTVTSRPQLKEDLGDSNISSDFCKFSSIVPRVVDEYATYTLTLDLNQFSSTLDNTEPNEFVLFFPYTKYPEIIDTLEIYSGTVRLQYEWIYKSMLSIRFGSTTSNISKGTSIEIKLVGIINPYLTINNQVYFGCSLNITDFRLGSRRTLIRGITTINEGILPANDAKFGNIIFKNSLCEHSFIVPNNNSTNSSNSTAGKSVFNEEKLNPREKPSLINPVYTSIHQFGITLDIANNNIANWENGFTYTGPTLYITFPSDYKFSWDSFVATSEVTAFTLDPIDLKTITEIKNFISVKSTTVIGNQLILTFNESTLTFDKYFQYFKIKLYNLPTPIDNTVNTNDGKITTSGFKFLLLNTGSNYIFKIFTNLNNFSREDILSNKIDLLLPQNKGFKYEFDQKKWIIDVIDKENQKINYITVNTGRYDKYAFKVRSSSKFLKPAVAMVSLTDNIFKFRKSEYEVSTSIYADIPFYIGCACTQNPGHVIANPTLTGSAGLYTSFSPLAPIQVNIHNKLKNKIMFVQQNIVRINGSLFVNFTLNDPSFNDISISFNSSSDSEIKEAKIASGDLTSRTVMSIINPQATTVQSYLLPKPTNDCYEFEHEKINFEISGESAIIPNDALKKSMFEYRNTATDSTVLPNCVKFILTTTYSQIYIYAALTCSNEEFPSDEQMKNQNVTVSSKLDYISEILDTSDTGNTDLVFCNLIRGTSYKLKVFIESTQGDKLNRTSSSIIIENYTNTDGTTQQIMAKKSFSPLCVSYRFDTRPGVQTTNPLLWYWQQKFASSGYYETGCINAVDQYGTEIPGLPSIQKEAHCGRRNCRFIDYNSYIVNQTSLNVSETYTICAYPLSTCKTDPTNYEEVLNDIMSNLPNNQTFKEVLNVMVVPNFKMTQVSDTDVPQKPNISNVKYSGNTIKFEASSTNSISCFAKVSGNSDTILDKAQFETCGSDCSVINISSTSGSYSVVAGNAGEQVTINMVCYNDMHCSSSSTSVLQFGPYTKSSATDATSGNTNNTSTNTTGDKGFFIQINILLLFVLSLLLA